METAAHWLGLARHTPLAVLADLDGTLVPFAATPEEARPGPGLVSLLGDLAALPGLSLAVASGRTRESLEAALAGAPDLWLVAEHGGWRRAAGAWQGPADPAPGATGDLAGVFEALASAYAGARVERKTWSVALHWRSVPLGARGALLVAAEAEAARWVAAHPGHERLLGDHVLEVRPARMRKSLAVSWLRERAGPGVRLLALGDDLTDEDVFRALGVGDEGILVAAAAGRPTAARWRLPGPEQVAGLLAWIGSARREEATPPLRVPPVPVVAIPRWRSQGAPRQDLLAISNRLPELRSPAEPGEGRARSVGGLVSAVEPVLASRGGLWLGWSGRTIRGADAPAVGLDADARPALAWVDLPEEWVERYYRGFCNRGLWPLLHSFPGRVRFADDEWASYERVNESFAEVAADLVAPTTPIWVHDFHLLLVARALRRRGHRGPLGLFLHVPFPGPDVFGLAPWAVELLDGMLDFDLIGFHTPGYVESFRRCVAALTPARAGDDAVEHRGRRVRLRALPIGILPEGFQEPPDPKTAEEVAALLTSISPTRLVLGVDRLDYTKGIPERLEAFGRLFERFPEWRGKVSLVQVSVPSRADVPEYAEQRRLVEGVVGRVNGEYGEAHWVPVRYLYRSYGRAHLAQLYRAADVGYVTPLRDGLNLVAKEYVAAQDPENPGVLVLSRFAGAAVELRDAVLTNPWHPDGMARDLDRALRMPLDERRDRHARLLAAVSRTTALTWAEEFLAALEACHSPG